MKASLTATLTFLQNQEPDFEFFREPRKSVNGIVTIEHIQYYDNFNIRKVATQQYIESACMRWKFKNQHELFKSTLGIGLISVKDYFSKNEESINSIIELALSMENK